LGKEHNVLNIVVNNNKQPAVLLLLLLFLVPQASPIPRARDENLMKKIKVWGRH